MKPHAPPPRRRRTGTRSRFQPWRQSFAHARALRHCARASPTMFRRRPRVFPGQRRTTRAPARSCTQADKLHLARESGLRAGALHTGTDGADFAMGRLVQRGEDAFVCVAVAHLISLVQGRISWPRTRAYPHPWGGASLDYPRRRGERRQDPATGWRCRRASRPGASAPTPANVARCARPRSRLASGGDSSHRMACRVAGGSPRIFNCPRGSNRIHCGPRRISSQGASLDEAVNPSRRR